MLKTIESINWRELTHAYGSAEDVPALLRGLTSPDLATVNKCLYELNGNVFHQGTRFEASRFVVPALFEIMAIVPPIVQLRVLPLLAALALRDSPPSDDSLPFRREVEFADAEGMSAADVATVYRQMVADEEPQDDELLDVAPTVWARDTYDAAASGAHELLVWAESRDAGFAAMAYSLTPWFPSLGARSVHKGVELLSSTRPPEHGVTILITLGLLGDRTASPAIHEQLRLAGDPVARTAAAIALALLSGSNTPDDALGTLLDADRWRAELDDASHRVPFARTLNGYVAKALRCVET